MSTILDGTCLLNGRHPEGSALARECPVLLAQRRAEHARMAARSRWEAQEDPVEHDPGLGPQADAQAACRRHRGCWTLGCQDCNPEAPRDSAVLPANWRRVRRDVIDRDGRRCKHCGTRDNLSVHHITPRPVGTNDPRNLVTLCSACHDAVEVPAESAAS